MRGRSQESDSLSSLASFLPSPSGTFVDSCDFFLVPLGSDAVLWASLFLSARCLMPAPSFASSVHDIDGDRDVSGVKQHDGFLTPCPWLCTNSEVLTLGSLTRVWVEWISLTQQCLQTQL